MLMIKIQHHLLHCADACVSQAPWTDSRSCRCPLAQNWRSVPIEALGDVLRHGNVPYFVAEPCVAVFSTSPGTLFVLHPYAL